MLVLSQFQQEEVYYKMKSIFSDFKYFDTHAASAVKALISDSTKVELDSMFVYGILERYVKNTEQYQSKEQKSVLESIKLVLTVTAVYLYSHHIFLRPRLFNSVDQLLEHYPQFKTQLTLYKPDDVQELQNLLRFRNFLMVALFLIPAKGNKTFLLSIVERLEGSSNHYITGSGQKPAVTRRCDIYHQEGQIEVSKKVTKRSRDNEATLMVASKEPSSGSSSYSRAQPIMKFSQENNENIYNHRPVSRTSSPSRKLRRENSKGHARSPSPPMVACVASSPVMKKSSTPFDMPASSSTNYFMPAATSSILPRSSSPTSVTLAEFTMPPASTMTLLPTCTPTPKSQSSYPAMTSSYNNNYNFENHHCAVELELEAMDIDFMDMDFDTLLNEGYQGSFTEEIMKSLQ